LGQKLVAQHSRLTDLMVALALILGATAIGFGFWRTRRT
jgi:hypothetical protein